jgi:hypothetical protein
MMNAEERRRFEELRTQVACDKKFACVEMALNDLCKAVYHPEVDILECQQNDPIPCKFARPFGCAKVCRCPLRKFIAQNFDKWSAESTAALRQAPN